MTHGHKSLVTIPWLVQPFPKAVVFVRPFPKAFRTSVVFVRPAHVYVCCLVTYTHKASSTKVVLTVRNHLCTHINAHDLTNFGQDIRIVWAVLCQRNKLLTKPSWVQLLTPMCASTDLSLWLASCTRLGDVSCTRLGDALAGVRRLVYVRAYTSQNVRAYTSQNVRAYTSENGQVFYTGHQRLEGFKMRHIFIHPCTSSWSFVEAS